MDKECNSPVSGKSRQNSRIESTLPCVSYLRNFTEATVLFWKLSNYATLRENVLYNRIFDVQGLRCDFKLMKSPERLFLCVCSEAFPRKIAEFLLVDEKNGSSLKCAAQELTEGCYVGEFQYVSSKYRRNGVFNVAFKYFTSLSTYYQDTLSEAAEPLTDAGELCSDYREAFMTGLHGDFIIQSSDYEFATHRFILAAHSEFFDEFFQKNQSANEFKCSDDITPSIMHKILLYLYSGELRDTNLQFMLLASDLAVKFGIKTLRHKCGRYFLRCIEEACQRTKGNNLTYHSGGQEKLDIDFMRIICEESFKFKRLEVFAQKCARYLKRNLDKFLHFETCLSTRKYKMKMDDIFQLWRLSHVRRLKDIRNQCAMILRRCIVDPLCFDAYVKTGEEMVVNLEGVLGVAEFAQKVRSVVLSKKCIKYIFDHFEVHESAANVTSNEHINIQIVSRILNIALKNRCSERDLIDKCITYCLNFMLSRENELFHIEDLASLIKVAYVAKKLEKNDFLAECVQFLQQYFQCFSDTYLHIKEGNSLNCFIRSTAMLHELPFDESLKRFSFDICHEIIKKNSLGVGTQDALRENIDLLKALLYFCDKLKRTTPKTESKNSKMKGGDDLEMEWGDHSNKESEHSTKKCVEIKKERHQFNKEYATFKLGCGNYIRKIVYACQNLAIKELFSYDTLKYMTFLYKFARKPTGLKEKLNDIIMKQINICADESHCLRQDHKLDSLIALCNITRKLKMFDVSEKCAEILGCHIWELNLSVRKNLNQKVLETSCIEPVVKTYKLFSRFQKRMYIDKQINENDEKSSEQKLQSDSNAVSAVSPIRGARKCHEHHRKFPYQEYRVQALLSQCETFFHCVLSKTRDSNISETDKVKVMKYAVEICDSTRYHFESQQMIRHLSKYGTCCRNIKLRRTCLEFMAVNMADDPYRSLAEPSQELLTEFMTKLYVLACELLEDIHGEKLIMENEEVRSRLPMSSELRRQEFAPIEESHALKLLEYWVKFFEKIREINISKVPHEIRKSYVARSIKLFQFAWDKSRPEQKLIKDTFSNYMFLSGSTAFVGRREDVDFNEVCKITEFAYSTKTEDLQNKCIEYFYQCTNRKNWEQLHDLAIKLRSHSLKYVALQNKNL